MTDTNPIKMACGHDYKQFYENERIEQIRKQEAPYTYCKECSDKIFRGDYSVIKKDDPQIRG